MIQTGRGTACTWASTIRMLCVQSPQRFLRNHWRSGWREDDEPGSLLQCSRHEIVGVEWCRVMMPYSRLRLRYVTDKFAALYGSLITREVDHCIYTLPPLDSGCR